MTKLRTPESVEDALDRAVGLVGADLVGQWIGKTASFVRKASDPDDDARHLSFADALEIDRQLILAGLGPVFAVVASTEARKAEAQRVDVALQVNEFEEPPMTAAVRVVGQASDLLEQLNAAESDGRVEPRELSALLGKLERLGKLLPKLRRSLFARQQKPARK